MDTPPFAMLRDTILQVVPDAIVAPYLLMGATDARHYAALTPNSYRFLAALIETSDLQRAHGTDERISVENYGRVVEFYERLIMNATQ